ncbi:MAG: hypothetical protein KDA87_13875, partial [Planctomycetales bacterium]|nr:hypothetical protein [Planctomycetales bacterium]
RLNIGNPFGVEIGPHNMLYVCEVTNHRIWKVDLENDRTTVIAGTGEPGFTGDGGLAIHARLNEPYEIRFAANNDIYFVEMRNHIVRRIDAASGKIETIAGTGEPGFKGDGGPARFAQLNQPHSLVLSDEYIYVADIGNHRIRRIHLQSRVIDSIAGNGQRTLPNDNGRANGLPVLGPRALFLQNKTLWVALREGHSIWTLDLENDVWNRVAGTGEKGYSGDNGPARFATFNGPKGLAVADGKVFVVDTENQVIRQIDLDNQRITTLAGSGPNQRGFSGDTLFASDAKLNRPHGICVGPRGAVYIGDSENHRVRCVLP